METSKLIKSLRTVTQLNQTDFAAKVGLSQNYISLLESGKKVPSEDAMQKIATCVGISKAAFMFLRMRVPPEFDDSDTQLFLTIQKNLFGEVFMGIVPRKVLDL